MSIRLGESGRISPKTLGDPIPFAWHDLSASGVAVAVRWWR
jgi:hypothetical protein